MLDTAVADTLRSGETVFLQGDAAEHFFIVLEGWVKLYRVDEHGNEAVVSVFSQSQSFGEAVALSSGTYPVSAEAVTISTVAKMSARLFVNRMTNHPELALAGRLNISPPSRVGWSNRVLKSQDYIAKGR